MIIQIYSEAKYLKQSNMHGIDKTDEFGFHVITRTFLYK